MDLLDGKEEIVILIVPLFKFQPSPLASLLPSLSPLSFKKTGIILIRHLEELEELEELDSIHS